MFLDTIIFRTRIVRCLYLAERRLEAVKIIDIFIVDLGPRHVFAPSIRLSLCSYNPKDRISPQGPRTCLCQMVEEAPSDDCMNFAMPVGMYNCIACSCPEYYPAFRSIGDLINQFLERPPSLRAISGPENGPGCLSFKFDFRCCKVYNLIALQSGK